MLRVPPHWSLLAWFETSTVAKGRSMLTFLIVCPSETLKREWEIGLENCQESNIINGLRLFITHGYVGEVMLVSRGTEVYYFM